MNECVVTVAGIGLCLETFGEPTDPPVLLIGGAAASMDWWDPALCRRLAEHARFVIRYDHRDTGRSASSPAGQPAYSGHDLATDPLRVLDGLGVPSAHLVGISMGGGIAQQLAAQYADRVRSITLIATSPAGERREDTELPPMAARVAAAFEQPAPEPEWADPAAVVEHLVAGYRPYAGGLGFNEDRVRGVVETEVARTRDMAASQANHWLLEDGPRDRFALADIGVPTLVLHGTDDPFFPYPHGEALAAEIPAAALTPLPGMGHEVPPPALWNAVIRAVVAHTAGA